MSDWQLQEAKAGLSELVIMAVSDGPQFITVHGEPAVVVISQKDYEKLIQPKKSFVDFLTKSPLKGVTLTTSRESSKTRGDIDL